MHAFINGSVYSLFFVFFSNLYMQWHGSDKKRIQYTCRHRAPYESEEELKKWDIDFPEDYD